MTLPSPLA
uniref:Uncharacterized protein n=1 Tax=Rhizophora mucronata TaxID=61149 RepID=A0A2P2JH04_RHIMU